MMSGNSIADLLLVSVVLHGGLNSVQKESLLL